MHLIFTDKVVAFLASQGQQSVQRDVGVPGRWWHFPSPTGASKQYTCSLLSVSCFFFHPHGCITFARSFPPPLLPINSQPYSKFFNNQHSRGSSSQQLTPPPSPRNPPSAVAVTSTTQPPTTPITASMLLGPLKNGGNHS